MKNVKKIMRFLILALVFALAASCSGSGTDGSGDVIDSGNGNSSNNNGNSSGVSVYVAGLFWDNDDFGYCYWKDGVKYNLPIPAGGKIDDEVLGLAVSGGSVYVSGIIYLGDYDNSIHCYWKDSIRFDLPIPAGTRADIESSSIAVFGGSVYVAGTYETGSWNDVTYKATACYWKDNIRTDLSVPVGANGYTFGITVSGGSVYVSGWYETGSRNDGTYKETACYWKDDVQVDLPASGNSYARGIVVSEGSVYVSGGYSNSNLYYYETTACYWKDNIRFDLPVPAGTRVSIESSITVSGGSVYVLRDYYQFDTGKYTSCYWKDGVRVDLPPADYIRSEGIAVSGESIIYVTGRNTNGVACYWKDGERFDLPPAGVNSAGINIAIVEN